MTVQIPLTTINQVPFLRTSREFPPEVNQLSTEINKAYVDIANAVNSRTISIFPTNRPAITGNNVYITGSQRQQTFRQLYSFTTLAPIPHGIKTGQIYGFLQGFGSYTDGINFYGLIFGSNTAIAGQISFYLTPTNIVFLSGTGAPTPMLGTLVIEWINNV
jgi:hypothetical protein